MKSTKRNLRRKEQRRIKKAKLAEYTNQSIDEGLTTPNSNDDQGITPDSINNQDNQADDERSEIFYDPKKHKIQAEARLSTEDQSREYIRSLWISEDFLANDLKREKKYEGNLHVGHVSSSVQISENSFGIIAVASGLKLSMYTNTKKLRINRLEIIIFVKCFRRTQKDKLYIALETTKKVAHGIDLEVAKNAQNVIDRYFYHTLNNPTHHSKQFASNMMEHFCSFTDSNNEPYTTANTASSHCQEHLACVQELIQGLQPFSDIVNNYFHNTYPTLHTNMKNLNLGPN
ncbi:1576_t:CDS:2, partial [Acaulospora colombiana]